MKKAEKREETAKLIDISKRSYYIIELINKLGSFICLVLMIVSLTIVIVGMSVSSFKLSSSAFWLLLICIIIYFISNFLKSILPRLDKNIQILNEYYKQNFEENN